MRFGVYGVCLIVALAGAIFFLQGIRILPSRLMYGQSQWVVIGAIMFLGAISTAVFAGRRKAR